MDPSMSRRCLRPRSQLASERANERANERTNYRLETIVFLDTRCVHPSGAKQWERPKRFKSLFESEKKVSGDQIKTDRRVQLP